jgi:uncharacterized protein
LNEDVKIEGPVGALQAILEQSVASGSQYGVLCHPHPLFGGTMDNKVVTTLARAMHDLNIPTLRFNFRGVGASAGEFDQGKGEIADADAVASWGARRWPGRNLVLAGFSFGAVVALKLALQRQAAFLITVAPAIQRFDIAAIEAPQCPWLLVQGDADDVVDPKAVIAWARGLRAPPRIVVLPAVGHFFHGHLQELRDAVNEAIRSG